MPAGFQQATQIAMLYNQAIVFNLVFDKWITLLMIELMHIRYYSNQVFAINLLAQNKLRQSRVVTIGSYLLVNLVQKQVYTEVKGYVNRLQVKQKAGSL